MMGELLSRPISIGRCLVVPRASRLTPTDVYLSLNGQFSPGYAQSYFQLEVLAMELMNVGVSNCSNFVARADVATIRFNNVTGEQERYTLSGTW